MKLSWIVLVLVFFTAVNSDCCLDVSKALESHVSLRNSSECSDSHKDQKTQSSNNSDCCQFTCSLKIAIPASSFSHVITFQNVVHFVETHQSFDPIYLSPPLYPPINS